MRIALVVHGFPPYERTGVENYTAGLAREFGRRGHTVEVFAPRRAADLPEHSLRREQRDGYAVTWITLNLAPDGPRAMLEREGVARSFRQFLEAERPEVVHLQHVVKLGLGPIFEASARGLPLLYTAHDYYAVCHRYTLLRPDLAHCDVRADFMACALCDASLGYLNGVEGLGDYQMGVLPDQLDDSQRAALEGLLEDDPEPAGWEQGALDAAVDLRRDLDSRRLQAFGRLDRVLAPTQFLADELARGGVDRERIQVLPYGVETRDLAGLEMPRTQGTAERPLRFAFIGGLSKHKGVHVLLDAFAGLAGDPRAQLIVRGYGTDAPYVERLRARASEVGASWGGAYDREDLPAILGAVDVVVVPSTWVENQPLVIREAFAAGRPVLASDFGAIPESVTHERDGLLFPVGDAAGLEAALRRCLDEPELLSTLRQGIGPVHDVSGQVDELETIYAELLATRSAPADASGEDAPPACVAPLARRLEELEALPTRALFAGVLAGLGQLRTALGARPSDFETRLARTLDGDPRARVALRDARRKSAWLELDLAATEASLREENAWLNEQAGVKDAELKARREEVDWLRSEQKARDEQIAWLEEKRGEIQARHDALAQDLEQIQRLERTLEESGEGLDPEELTALEHRFASVRQHVRELTGQAASISGVAHHLLEAQALFVSAELAPLTAELHALLGESDPTDPPASGEDPPTALLQRVRRAGVVGAQLLRELGWRREAMQVAQDKYERRFAALLLGRTGLGREVRSWGADAAEGDA